MKIQKAIYFTPTTSEAWKTLKVLKDEGLIKGDSCSSSQGTFDYRGENSHHVKEDYRELFSPVYLSHRNQLAIEDHWKGVQRHQHGFDENYKVMLYYNVDVYENSVCAFQFEPYDVCEDVNGRKQQLDIRLDDPYFMRKYHEVFMKLQNLGWNPVAL